MGAHKRTSVESYEQHFGVSKIIVHENYKKPIGMSNDIALLKLDHPAKLDRWVTLEDSRQKWLIDLLLSWRFDAKLQGSRRE